MLWMATDVKTGKTYIAEQARRPDQKISWTVMPAICRGINDGDYPVAPAKVPLYLRRAGKDALALMWQPVTIAWLDEHERLHAVTRHWFERQKQWEAAADAVIRDTMALIRGLGPKLDG